MLANNSFDKLSGLDSSKDVGSSIGAERTTEERKPDRIEDEKMSSDDEHNSRSVVVLEYASLSQDGI
jgi:hypothetical protein